MYRSPHPRFFVSVLLVLGLFLCTDARGQSELVVRVIALDPAGVAVADIRFTYQGVETAPTTDAGMTEVRVPLGAGRTIPAGSAIELSLPGSVGATWFLIDDTVHVPGPGAPPAEVVVMKRADMLRLAGDVSYARVERLAEEMSPAEERRVLLAEAERYGLGEGELERALRAFGESAEGPLEEGIAEYLAGQYEAAEGNLRKALEDAEERRESGERITAEAEQDILESARYLGQTLYEQGRYSEAAGAFRKAVEVGTEDTVLASWLVTALLESAKWDDAETVARRALTIEEERFGPKHPNVAVHLNNLASLLQATNRLADAEPLMRRVLAITEASFGPEHPNVAIRLNNLAQLLQDTNRLAEAEPLIRRALGIDEASFGPEHPDVAIDLNNLALLLQKTNRLAEAEPLMRRAVEILETSLVEGHPWTAVARQNLDDLLQELEETTEAE